jgi:hypothetical protein
MSQYPYPEHYCQTPSNLDLYPSIAKEEMKSVDAKFQVKVRYWASTNHLEDYKIYGTKIKMFMLDFLNNLPQSHPWPAHSTNKKFRTRFHRQCNYLLGFQAPKNISDSILENKWPRNKSDAEDDPYETLTFAHNEEMD